MPPYLTLDRAAQGFKDLSMKTTVTALKGIGTVKRYFHRLFPCQEGINSTAMSSYLHHQRLLPSGRL